MPADLQSCKLWIFVSEYSSQKAFTSSLTKKRKAGSPPKVVFFGSYPEDERLCVVKCLKQYEDNTKEFCPDCKDNQQISPLFLSYIKPHHPVTSQRIVHWIKNLFGRSGIDTTTFKAHSVRGVFTLAALSKDVSIQDQRHSQAVEVYVHVYKIIL